LPIAAVRVSHSTSSNGSTPAYVKKRGKVSPGAAVDRVFDRGLSVSAAKGGNDALLSTDCWLALAW
jgi:hypothetical protein